MQETSELKSRTEKLSKAEIFLLRKRMIIVWLFAVLISVIAAYFLFGKGISDFSGMKIPVIIFSFFFFGILSLIVFVHTRNAFQTHTIIYSGRITEKKTEASRMKDSQLNEEFYIAVENKWFRVEWNYFKEIHLNDHVEVFTLGKNQVFKVEKKDFSNAGAFIKPALDSVFSEFSERMSSSDKIVLRNALMKALFFRTVLGFLGCYLLFQILILVSLILDYNKNEKVDSFLYLYDGILFLAAILYILLNRKSWKLGRDYFSGEKEVVIEKIVDLIRSTHPKPGPNSILRNNASRYSHARFFYVQTSNFWIQVNESVFQNSKAGEEIEVHTGKYSRLVLQVKTKFQQIHGTV